MKVSRKQSTRRRHGRIRRKVVGTTERPRLAVFRSNQHIYAQVIDDSAHHTVAASSTLDGAVKEEIGTTNSGNQAAAALVGKSVAEKAIAAGIKEVVFDRGGKLYHGRVKALAEAAREAGLEF